MKATIKKAAALAAAAAMTFVMSVSAYAEDRTEDYTREEIIQQYWGDYWEDSLPGEQNPEGSLEYHILEQWLDEQYGHTYREDTEKYTVSRWSSYWSIRDAWQDYREEYTQYWHMVDDQDTGEFYIESYDPETDTYGDDVLYTFDFADGKWNMIDANGNIADSFDPHGGDGSWAEIKENHGGDVGDYNVSGITVTDGKLGIQYGGKSYYIIEADNDKINEIADEIHNAMEEDDEEKFNTLLEKYGAIEKTDSDAEKEQLTDNKTNEATAQAATRVTGDTANGQPANTAADKAASPSEAAGEKAVAAQTDNKETVNKGSGSSLPFIIGGIVIVAAAAAGGYAVASKKRKDDGK